MSEWVFYVMWAILWVAVGAAAKESGSKFLWGLAIFAGCLMGLVLILNLSAGDSVKNHIDMLIGAVATVVGLCIPKSKQSVDNTVRS